VVEGGPLFLRRHRGLYDSAWSTSTRPFDLYKVSWGAPMKTGEVQ
jgi:hypothetical protein